MGFFIRKAFTFGPIRFNLSKSGIGMSAGVKGARLGINSRGRSYVHMGRHGLYYRKFLDSPPASSAGSPSTQPSPDSIAAEEGKIHTAGATELVDSSARDLLRELRESHQKIRLAPVALWSGFGVVAVMVIGGLPAIATCLAVPILAAGWHLGKVDIKRKRIVLEYDLDSEARAAYESLLSALRQLGGCNRVWRVRTSVATDDWKHNAGASGLITRKLATFDSMAPPYIEANVSPAAIRLQDQTLYFMPDRLLVYEGSDVGAVSYDDLQVNFDHQRFIEESGVPHDAKVVDETWRYVNKKGGPDRRFKDNYTIPVCNYGQIDLRSDSGMHLVLLVSNALAAEAFYNSVLDGIARLQKVSTKPDPTKLPTTPTPPHSSVEKARNSRMLAKCPACGKVYRLPIRETGRRAKCACGGVFTVHQMSP